MAFYLRTVVVASLIGGIAFSAVTTLLERKLELAEGTLPAATLSGLILATAVAIGLWMLLRLRWPSGHGSSPSLGSDQKAVLAGLVAVPFAAWLSMTLFTAWNESRLAVPEVIDSLPSLSIAGSVFYLLILSTVHFAIGTRANEDH